MTLSVFISAGEASGDALAAGLLRALSLRRPGLVAFGMGGPALRSAGAELVAAAPGVSGLVEVVGHLPALFRLERRLGDCARTRRPDVGIFVDFPDFNLRLARRLKTAGIPCVQYVGPSVWAWRPGRADAFGATFEKILLLFPFEVGAWRGRGARIEVVGHPVADLRPSFADPDRPPWFALLPGSRPHEVERHLPILLEAASRCARVRPSVRFRLFVAPGLDATALARRVEGQAVELVRPPIGASAAGATGALVAAGTASLEVALAGVPTLVGYRMSPASFGVLSRMVRVPRVSLPNLVLGRAAVPELLQDDFHPLELTAWMARALDRGDLRCRARGDAEQLAATLGSPGASERAADAVLAVLDGRGPRG